MALALMVCAAGCVPAGYSAGSAAAGLDPSAVTPVTWKGVLELLDGQRKVLWRFKPLT
jgi:hypothetical protein